MAWTTKSPIPGNHWVPLGCRALLGSVKPRQLMLSDRICCQTIEFVRQPISSDRQCCQKAKVVRQLIWSDNRAIPVIYEILDIKSTDGATNFAYLRTRETFRLD